MAAVSVRTASNQRLPGITVSSRAPLRDAPSAVLNSPLRGASTATVGSKRSRHNSADPLDASYENGPQTKRVAAQFDDPEARVNLGQRRAVASQNQRRIEVARPTRSRPMQEHTAEAVRTWQRHYRKAFPSMVFYFESIPRDLVLKLSSQVKNLGAVRFLFEELHCLMLTDSRLRRHSSPKA
jgi:regulatory subunit for Cdc7p protein kinase